ncbi:MAG: flagellar assembly protein FliH [Methylosarcina sp.]
MISSSKTSEFSSSELGSLELWNLPKATRIDISKDSESTVFSPDRSPKLTVEDIELMQRQAYEEAFAQGKKDGFQQGLEEGSQKGFEEGLKKGYEENVHLLQKQASEFVHLMQSLSEPFNNLDQEVENELVRLVIGIATQLIRREIKMDPGQVVAAVKDAIKVLPLSSQKIYLYLHPDDAVLLRTVLSPAELSPPWNVIEDPLITKGGCKVDTEVSHIDASVENRLASVISNIFGGERQGDKIL